MVTVTLTMAMMIMMGEEETVQVRNRPFIGHPVFERTHARTTVC